MIGLTINHEGMRDADVTAAIIMYERELGIPATDALTRPTDELVEMVTRAFSGIRRPVRGEKPGYPPPLMSLKAH